MTLQGIRIRLHLYVFDPMSVYKCNIIIRPKMCLCHHKMSPSVCRMHIFLRF